ncbi:DUF1993 domain-containing protein [Erythrobacter sp. JK5]|uniref:DUF1993 family protein n=1 Tax=Erythrobacter sp. JK5 TaxID=2829500 RepID=UPI001BAD947E|nr:DUF1993 domain-containing protein [Erythrobacter sp. JK5]QUL37301.1 DUF1993 domain-containing protein [Erythrobacter sp. JK5]
MSIKEQIVPVWSQMLAALDGLLAKAEADPQGDALLGAKLAEDMHDLSVQVRFLCNMPGEAVARLAGIAFTSTEENPGTLAEAREWIATRRKAIEEWSKLDFVADDAAIELVLPNGMTFDLNAQEYVRDWALAQFYFHLTTAYAILRKEGLAIGKIDFVPYMLRYMRQPATA